MLSNNKACKYIYILLIGGFLGLSPSISNAAAIDIPASADAGRIKPEEKLPGTIPEKVDELPLPYVPETTLAPEGAENIRFVLKELKVEGLTAFPQNKITEIYAVHLETEISLKAIYEVADKITALYRENGFFLSLAYVPEQGIKDGKVVIKVVEGKIGKVSFNSKTGSNHIIKKHIKNLERQNPLTSEYMESFLLRLNDLPGYSFSGVLSLLEGGKEGEVELTLIAKEKKGRFNIGFDNFSSRFLGPNQLSANYTDSFLPMQQTIISGGTTLPVDELNYTTLSHEIALAPNLVFSLTGSITRAEPGYTLKPFDVQSDSSYLAGSFSYQAIRQRDKNLSLKLTLDSRNSDTDSLGIKISQDRIRAVRANAVFDKLDNWHGYNIASLTLSHGINAFGSSDAGDLDISRAEAKPDFRKAELTLTRLQDVGNNFSILLSTQGQVASGPLYSSEEFGYGGQSFGRAYDASEISGEHGLAATAELRYNGFEPIFDLNTTPYIFYDIGRVWNDDTAQISRESGSSAGFGTRISSDEGISANIGLAFPITRSINSPIYGQSKEGPRILLQVGKSF